MCAKNAVAMGASPIRPYCARPSTASAVTPAAREAHRKPTYACVSHPPGVGTNGNHMRPWRGITALPTPLRWAKPHTTSLRRPVSHFNHPIRSAKQRHAAAREAYRKPTLTKGGHKWQPYTPLARYNRPQTPLRCAPPTQPHCAAPSTTFNHPIRSAKQRHAAAREAYRKPTLTKGGHKWQPYAPLARHNRLQTPLRWRSPTQPHCAGLSTTSTIPPSAPNSVAPAAREAHRKPTHACVSRSPGAAVAQPGG